MTTRVILSAVVAVVVAVPVSSCNEEEPSAPTPTRPHLSSSLSATVLVEQSDGSIASHTEVGCDNRCWEVLIASQVFKPNVAGHLGAITVFTANFHTNSSSPSSNSCRFRIFNDDTGELLTEADNYFTGYNCAGDLTFYFNNTVPFLETDTHYRWEFLEMLGHFASCERRSIRDHHA